MKNETALLREMQDLCWRLTTAIVTMEPDRSYEHVKAAVTGLTQVIARIERARKQADPLAARPEKA